MWSEDIFICRKKEATILDCVRFTMKSHRHFQCHHRNRCIIALDVEKAEMLSRLSWTMKMKVFRRQLRRWQKELESSCRKRKKAKRAEGRQIIEVFYLPYKKKQHVIFTISLWVKMENEAIFIFEAEDFLMRQSKILVLDMQINTQTIYIAFCGRRVFRMHSLKILVL